MLEEMGAFFDNRLSGYEAHQLTAIESAREFYPYTAACLPTQPGAKVLDLGCGTGLELDFYFPHNPTAQVTGIDLAEGMLKVLGDKFSQYSLTVIPGSYFQVPFPPEHYDAVVSVESLHHFTQAEKIPLYRKVFQALKPGGYLILTDYFADSEQAEQDARRELLRRKTEEGIQDQRLYHFDTPLTVEHEVQALKAAGFPTVSILGQWGATCTIQAAKTVD